MQVKQVEEHNVHVPVALGAYPFTQVPQSEVDMQLMHFGSDAHAPLASSLRLTAIIYLEGCLYLGLFS